MSGPNIENYHICRFYYCSALNHTKTMIMIDLFVIIYSDTHVFFNWEFLDLFSNKYIMNKSTNRKSDWILVIHHESTHHHLM